MIKYTILLVLFCTNALALETLKIENGRYVTLENNLTDRSQPALIFLPGINRALDERDSFIQLAKKAKINFVSIHFSLHPESVLSIPANETPYFKLNAMRAKDLADEVRFVIKKYKIAKPIIIGLSYSSVVTSELVASGKFPLVVETAPMIRYDESDPTGAQTTSFWKDYLGLYPVYGTIWQNLFLTQVYEKYWTDKVDKILEQYPDFEGDAVAKSNLVSAYASLSIVVDGFDFSTQDFTTGTKRLFILGTEEDAHRYELQQSAIELYETQSGEQNSWVLVKGAGHIVPSDNPKAYLRLMKKLIVIK